VAGLAGALRLRCQPGPSPWPSGRISAARRQAHCEQAQDRRWRRLLFLDKETTGLVRRYRKEQARERAYLGEDWQGGDLVFTTPLTDSHRAPMPGRP
jgi:hypothetical protein